MAMCEGGSINGQAEAKTQETDKLRDTEMGQHEAQRAELRERRREASRPQPRPPK